MSAAHRKGYPNEPGHTAGWTGSVRFRCRPRILHDSSQRTRVPRRTQAVSRFRRTLHSTSPASGSGSASSSMTAIQLPSSTACRSAGASCAAGCRYSDCTHMQEPGCAVRQAVAEGCLRVAARPAQKERGGEDPADAAESVAGCGRRQLARHLDAEYFFQQPDE